MASSASVSPLPSADLLVLGRSLSATRSRAARAETPLLLLKRDLDFSPLCLVAVLEEELPSRCLARVSSVLREWMEDWEMGMGLFLGRAWPYSAGLAEGLDIMGCSSSELVFGVV